MQHPVTTEFEMARNQVVETLHAVRDLGMPTLWFWPNVDAGSDGTSKGMRAFREIEQPANIHFFKNMTPEDFLKLIYNSRCLIGNSSVGIRESSFLGVPAVNIGDRQAGRERGANTIDAGHQRQEIADAIRHHLGNGKLQRDTVYGDGRAGTRIADLLSRVELRVEKSLTY
jgi:UDP-N-acetylglucosamine 2-epimerase